MPMVVTRKKHERVQIGSDIVIEVTEIRGSKEVRLAVLAPRGVPIVRLKPRGQAEYVPKVEDCFSESDSFCEACGAQHKFGIAGCPKCGFEDK